MSEHVVGAIHKATEAMLQMQDAQMRTVVPLLQNLGHLPGLVEQAARSNQQALSDLQSILVQIRLAEVSAEGARDAGALEGEQRAHAEKTAELEGDQRRLAERYEKVLEDLDDEAVRRVRALDGPVLSLLDVFFQRALLQRYWRCLGSGRQTVDRHRVRALRERRGLLSRALETASLALEGFLARRRQTDDELGRHALPVAAGPPGTRRVPVVLGQARTGSGWVVHVPSPGPAAPQMGERAARRVTSELEGGGIQCQFGPGAERRSVLVEALREIARTSDLPGRRRAAEHLAGCLEKGDLELLEAAK